MKCQRCHEREATTHMTEIHNGKKQELHLCSACAAQSPELQTMKSGMDFGIGDFLGGIFGGSKVKTLNHEPQQKTRVCPDCGMPFEYFLQKGRLGCGGCYEAFRGYLERPLHQIHGTCEHVGKVPSRMGGTLQLNRKLAKLETALHTAVAKQEFEKAAKLRDQIIACKAEAGEEA